MIISTLTLIAWLLMLVGCAGEHPLSELPPARSLPTASESITRAELGTRSPTASQPTGVRTPVAPRPTATAASAPSTPGAVLAATAPQPAATTLEPTAVVAKLPFSYPLPYAGRTAGDGFYIRHSFSSENTWYNPGYWHTGEDWYAVEGETAGAPVVAVADGSVVYAGSNYPGRVVIVEHALPDGALLYSMYGHLDPALLVGEGDSVTRGQQLGTVLLRRDSVPSHLHFEIRDFLLRDPVNGDAPRYGFRCGRRCPPGPGYWPIEAPELPAALGWRTPALVILALPATLPTQVLVAALPLTPALPIFSGPPDMNPQPLGRELPLTPGTTYDLLDLWAGPDAGQETSSTAYQVWYRLRLPDGSDGWVQALRPWDFETGSDGRPSSVRIDLLLHHP